LEQRDSCPDTFWQDQVVLPETKDAMVSGTCFISRKPGPEPGFQAGATQGRGRFRS
jgi:hypothetical protein